MGTCRTKKEITFQNKLTSKLSVKLSEIKENTTIDKMSPIKNETGKQIMEKA